MIQSASNNIFVTVVSKYISNFSSLIKIAAIQNNASIHLEDLVEITGTVVSIPNVISKDRWHEGYTTEGIKVGDRLIFSFSVIYDYIVQDATLETPPLYKNLINYQGNEFWACDITKAFAIIRGEKIIMLNGYVMVTPIPEDKIFLQASSGRTKGCKETQIMWIGEPKKGQTKLKLKTGDTISINPKAAQKYQINDKHFVIIQQSHIFGKVIKSKK